MKEDKVDIINKIGSDYILKSLFSYINYERTLKVIQKNKNLQNRLGIKLQNYQNLSNYPNYEYIKESKIIEKKDRNDVDDLTAMEKAYQLVCYTCATIFLFLYILIYSILLASLDTFNNSNTKDNYNKTAKNTIKIINRCLFLFVISIISSWSLLIFYVYKKCISDYGYKKVLKSILLILINIIYILFEFLIIWKLVLCYKIIKGSIPWFMKLDYAFIFINFAYIIFLISCTIYFFHISGKHIEYSSKIYLISFNKIKIRDFILPDDFHKWELQRRKKFVLSNYKNYEYEVSSEQFFLNLNINNIRIRNSVPETILKKVIRIPECVVYKPIEEMLYPEKQIFKLSDKKYLLKYNVGELKNSLEKYEPDALKILLKDNLTNIQIITQEKIEYLILSEIDSEIDNYNENDSSKEEKNLDSMYCIIYSKELKINRTVYSE